MVIFAAPHDMTIETKDRLFGSDMRRRSISIVLHTSCVCVCGFAWWSSDGPCDYDIRLYSATVNVRCRTIYIFVLCYMFVCMMYVQFSILLFITRYLQFEWIPCVWHMKCPLICEIQTTNKQQKYKRFVFVFKSTNNMDCSIPQKLKTIRNDFDCYGILHGSTWYSFQSENVCYQITLNKYEYAYQPNWMFYRN